MVILGVDPGLRFTGFGVIDEQYNILGYGVIKPEGETLAEKLNSIYNQFNEVIEKFNPDVAVVESTIYYRNVKTALTLGAVRGILLLSLVRNNIEFYEVSPTRVKLSITGVGRARKEQLEYMVKKLLGLKEKISSHESDALAISLYYLRGRRNVILH